MWEEPRPERLRQIESKRRREVVSSVIAYAVIFGVAAILWNANFINSRGGPGDEPNQSAPTVQPDPPAAPRSAAPQPAQRQPEITVNRTPADPFSPGTTSRSAPTRAARGDPSVLRGLTDTCRYWVEQNTRGQYSGNQETACRQMTEYARTHGYQVPSIGGSSPRLPSGTRETSAGQSVRVDVNQCEGHGYGSISYRQCRASEKQRLTNWCNSLTARRDSARGTSRDTLSLQATAVCSEANRYAIVR